MGRKSKSLIDQAGELAGEVGPHVETATEKAKDKLVNDYLPAAQDLLHEAKKSALTAAEQAQTQVAEAISDKPAKRRRRKRRFLMLGLVAVVAAVVVKVLKDKSNEPDVPAYVPPPPPAPPVAVPPSDLDADELDAEPGADSGADPEELDAADATAAAEPPGDESDDH